MSFIWIHKGHKGPLRHNPHSHRTTRGTNRGPPMAGVCVALDHGWAFRDQCEITRVAMDPYDQPGQPLEHTRDQQEPPRGKQIDAQSPLYG